MEDLSADVEEMTETTFTAYCAGCGQEIYEWIDDRNLNESIACGACGEVNEVSVSN